MDVKALDKFFQDKTFINGERLSVADLYFVANMKQVFDETAGKLLHFGRYYQTVINQPEFGEFLESSAEKAETKSKDPFAATPATKFDFDDWKRMYSNNPPETYLPYFWEKFDTENCSIWFCEYKFPEELGLAFMSTNLVRGALQRLDKARKQSFGSMAVFGEDGKNTIAGLWVWRGNGLMFELSSDWQVDYESFTWKKLDAQADETKKLVELFFKQDESAEYKGMKLNDGKIFK